jgi:hypothetical protein
VSPPAPGPRGRSRWLSPALLAVAVGFGVVAVGRNWSAVRADLALLGWADLLGSGLAAVGAVLLTGLSWRVVLTGLGAPMPLRPAMTLYSAGQLGKYVPGSVWVLAIQAELGRRRGVSRAVMALSYVVSILVAVATGGLIGLLSLLAAGDGSPRLLAPGLAAVGVLVALAVLRPRLVNAGLAWLSARTGRDLPAVDLPARTLASALALTSAAWVLFGLHVWLLARPLGAEPGLLAPTTGAFALAFVAGLLLVPVPAGAGVREGVLVGLLAGPLGATAALTVSVVSRLVLVVADVLLAGVLGVPAALAAARRSTRAERG